MTTTKAILFFNSTKAWGGGEKWHLELAQQLLMRGYRVHVFAHPQGVLYQRAQKAGLSPRPATTRKLSFLNPLKIKKLADEFGQIAPQIIIMNLSQDMKLAGLAARRAGISHVIYRRGSAIPIKNTLLNRWLFKNILTGIIANTQATRETILQNNKHLFAPEKIRVIYNGIDLQAFDASVISRDKKPDRKIVLGTLGRLEKQKAQHELIYLADKLKQAGYDFEMMIGGTGSLENNLKDLTRQKKLEDVVKFVGFVSNSRQFMDELDIFLLPSLWEGFGYVLVEAMAAQKPLVAYLRSSNPEIVTHNVSGLLAAPNDADDFFRAVVSLMDNAELRKNMGQNGRRAVESRFSLSRTADELEKYIAQLTKSGTK